MSSTISLISTGGTISEVGPGGGLAAGPTLHAADLLRSLPVAAELGEIRTVSAMSKRSDDITLRDLIDLAATVRREIDSGSVGVVVALGTDTLEEAAFALDLLVESRAPVVVTGAMRPHGALVTDGLANLVSAIRVARCPSARGLGTLVVFDDAIHAARFVEKAHVSSLSAFQSRPVGPVGWLAEDRVRIGLRPGTEYHVKLTDRRPPVVVIARMSLGSDENLVAALGSLGCDALIVEGFGGGHVPAAVVAQLGGLCATVPVVISTRVASGEVLRATYSGVGDELDLRARGLMSGGILSSAKAHILISLLLMEGISGDGLAQRFEQIASGCPGESTRLDEPARQGE